MARDVSGMAERFSTWVDANYASLFRLAIRLVGGRHDEASDMLSAVLQYLWRLCKQGEFESETSFLNLARWLIRRRQAYTLKLVARSEQQTSLEALAEEEGFEAIDLRQDIDRVDSSVGAKGVLERLPNRDRFLLCCLSDGSQQSEIAAQLGVSRPVICRQLAQARERLERLLEECAMAKTDVAAALLSESSWHTRAELAKQVGRSRDWVAWRLCSYTDCSRQAQRRGRSTVVYPRFVLTALLRESQMYKEADGWLTVEDIAQAIGCPWDWAATRLAMLNIQPETRLHSRLRQPLRFYHPSVVTKLRQLRASIVPAGDWLTSDAVAQAVGRHPWWIVDRLRQAGVEAEVRLNKAGYESAHWPPRVVGLLHQLNHDYPPSGDWVTIPDICRAVGKDRCWVATRLDAQGWVPETRLVQAGRCQREFDHYPPTVVPMLRGLAENEQAAGDWLTTRQVADNLGRGYSAAYRWLRGRPYEMRLAANGRLEKHYSPAVLRDLSLSDVRQVSDGWWTMLAISSALVRSQGWVKKQLADEPSEQRRCSNGLVVPHYPPEVFERLRQLSDATPRRGDRQPPIRD